MQIRPYTVQETNELIGKFFVIADYQYSISEAVYVLILQKYSEYLDNFSASLFNWSPYNFEKFCKQLACSGVRFTDYSLSFKNLFEQTFFNKPFKVVIHTFYSTIFDDVFTKHGVTGFTESEFQIIEDAAYLQHSFIFNWNLHSKYTTLVKYASQPFQFDETDIKWLEEIERLYVKAQTWNSN